MGNLPPSSDLKGKGEFKDVLYQREHGYPGWYYVRAPLRHCSRHGVIAGMRAAAPLLAARVAGQGGVDQSDDLRGMGF